MTKELIHQLSWTFAAPVSFAKKANGGLRFCIDYQDENSKPINNEYPLPLIKDSLKVVEKANIYSKLDVRGAYNWLWVKEVDEYKSAFWTRWGLIEPMVMQFGTTNALADFQGYINNAIREALDDFASSYLDVILIYGDSEEQYIGHVKWNMQCLLEAGLYLKPENCEFHKETVRYSGLIISTKGISMDEDEVETVWNWSPENKTNNGWLNNLFEVQQFLSFCNYHQRFIPKYSVNAEPLTMLTKWTICMKIRATTGFWDYDYYV